MKDDNVAYIVNYEAFSVGRAMGMDHCIEMLTEAKSGVQVIMDESTHIKSHKAKRTNNIIHMFDETRKTDKDGHVALRRVICLSGCPAPNNVDEYWAHLRATGAFTKKYFSFRNYFCEVERLVCPGGDGMGKMGGKFVTVSQGPKIIEKVVGMNKETEHELMSLLSSAAFVATKEDWSDLPDKRYALRNVKMKGKQEKMYREMEKNMVCFIDNLSPEQSKEHATASQILVKLGKLRQISSGFVSQTDVGLIHALENPKLDELVNVLGEMAGKAIIVCEYKYSIEQIKEKLGDSATLLVGGMSADEITESKRMFNEDPKTKYIICQAASGRYGHTLLGDQENKDLSCHTTIFYENSFSYETRTQLEDRNHRWGQKNSVLYIDFAASEMEARILEALKNKRKVSDAVINFVKGANQ